MVNSFTILSLVPHLDLHSLLHEADSYSLNLSTAELQQELTPIQLFTQYSILNHNSFHAIVHLLVLHTLSDS